MPWRHAMFCPVARSVIPPHYMPLTSGEVARVSVTERVLFRSHSPWSYTVGDDVLGVPKLSILIARGTIP